MVGAKCLSMLIQESAAGNNEFAKPTVWITVVVWLCLVFYWLRRLDWGFELFPVSDISYVKRLFIYVVG